MLIKLNFRHYGDVTKQDRTGKSTLASVVSYKIDLLTVFVKSFQYNRWQSENIERLDICYISVTHLDFVNLL